MRALLLACLVWILTIGNNLQQPAPPLHLSADTTLTAGDAWQVTIEGTPNQSVDLALLTGLQVLSTTLTLDDTGTATWPIEAGRIINSGTALLTAQAGEQQATLTLQVRPARLQKLDLLTAANTIRAYAEDEAQVIALGVDEWGNPATQRLSLVTTYPQTAPHASHIALRNGFGWWWLPSHSLPGRIQVQVASTTLVIQQTAGTPRILSLSLSVDCLPLNIPATLVVSAEARDAYGQIVPDGTLLHVTWTGGGQGWVSTIEGRAILRLPTPAQRGLYRFVVASDTYQSDGQWLHVGVCDEP
ncbi:MAG: hypothetical protein H6673_06000 [Anaerolineales bacterium]|nr:hypothetical protein [Anaerolineales bacterium]